MAMHSMSPFGAPMQRRSRSDVARRSAYGGRGTDAVQGPRRFDFWSNIGNAVKKGVKDTGNAVKKAATDTGHFVGEVASNPWVQGLTEAALIASGVGAPEAAAIMAAEKGGGNLLKPGGNIGSAATGAAEGAAIGAAGIKLSAVAKAALADYQAHVANGSAPPPDASVDGTDPAAGDSENSGSGDVPIGGGTVDHGFMSGLTDAIGQGADAIKSFLAKNGSALLAGANILEAGKNSKAASDYANQALATEQGLFNAKAPLRSAGIAGMLNPSQGTPDLSNLRALAGSGSGNPFAKPLPVASSGPSTLSVGALPLASAPVSPGTPISVGMPPSAAHGLPVASGLPQIAGYLNGTAGPSGANPSGAPPTGFALPLAAALNPLNPLKPKTVPGALPIAAPRAVPTSTNDGSTPSAGLGRLILPVASS